MKYSVLGYNQKTLLEFNDAHKDAKLDLQDLLLLDYITEAQGRPSIEHEIFDDTCYAWINRNSLLQELPILDIKENMLSKRLSKLVSLKLLQVKCISNKSLRGSKSFYTITTRALALKYDDYKLDELTDDINTDTTRCKKLHTVQRPGVKNYTSVYTPINTPISNKQDTNNTKNTIDNIKIKKNKGSSRKGIFESKPSSKELRAIEVAKIYNEVCTNLAKVRVLNEDLLDKIAQLLEEYSLDEFVEACSIANKTPFLLGDNDRGWKANFRFLLRLDKLDNILNGEYDKGSKSKKSPIQDAPNNKGVKSRKFTEEERQQKERMLQEMRERGEQIEY